MKVLALIILANVIILENASAQQRVTDASILDRKLSQGYDWRQRPPPDGPPTHVTVNIYLRRLKLNGRELEAEITYRQEWNDPRLEFVREYGVNAPVYVHIHPLDKTERRIWQPDTFFSNAYDVQIQSLPSPNELLRIHGNGNVLSSQKLTLKVPCSPVDKNNKRKCDLDIASYANTKTYIIYDWKTTEPITWKAGLNVSANGFILEDEIPEHCDAKTTTGEYSCIRASLIFRDHSSHSLSSAKLYFIPLLLALLSLLPMAINAQSITVRVLIAFFCLSTLILHIRNIEDELPRAGYPVGVDVWASRCLGFIAATFIQLIFYVWIVRGAAAYKQRKLDKQRIAKEKVIITRKEGEDDNIVLLQPVEAVVPERKLTTSLLVDIISLIIFLLAFLVFLFYYFSKY